MEASVLVPLSPSRVVDAARRTLQGALAAILLTTAHHVYGAYVYDTPWRNHVAHVAGIAAALLVASFLVFRRREHGAVGAVALWVFVAVTVVFPVVGIGLFEGGYNHAAKIALYFGGSSLATMQRFFPAPTYELPSDVFFEGTGVLQLALGWVAAGRVLALLRERRRRVG